MDSDILASQKRQDALAAFWPRRLSPYVTRVLVKTPITPNQTTVLWGIISVLNSYTVYLVLMGRWAALPLIPVIFQLAFVFDCVDGEIARFKNMASPIAGKLLDGVCHRATEFALLTAFAIAAYAKSGSWVALGVGLLLTTGDAMYIYVYERRLSALRASGYTGLLKQKATGVFQRGTRWNQLTRQQQIRTITELFHYKSLYAVVALSLLPIPLFLAGLALLGAYKHWKWLRLLQRALADASGLDRGVSAASQNAVPVSPAQAADPR